MRCEPAPQEATGLLDVHCATLPPKRAPVHRALSGALLRTQRELRTREPREVDGRPERPGLPASTPAAMTLNILLININNYERPFIH